MLLDLRGSPGGLLDAVVNVATLMLPPRSNVLEVDGQGKDGPKVLYQAMLYNPKGLTPEPEDWPLRTAQIFVLVSSFTSAGAEALVAALMDNHRSALVIGQPTNGHAVIKQVFPLDAGGAIQLVTGHMLPPSGKSWAGTGLSPQALVSSNPAGHDWVFGMLPSDTQLAEAVLLVNGH